MNKQQLEAAVLATVDHVRNGGTVEDDRIELKREWPSVTKARQLAAAANQAQGDFIIYVIGIDEATGRLHSWNNIDPAIWWAQMSAQFDEVAPDLAHHLTVHVAPGEAVAALLFHTDRAPYVIKVANGSAEREVPIRAGTRTRSAYRHELIRLLVPAASVPPVTPLDVSLSGQWIAAREQDPPRPAIEDATHLHGSASLFIEHTGPGALFLPAHDMHCEVVTGEWRIPLSVHAWPGKEERPAEPFGVLVRGDGVAVTGPGRFTLNFNAKLSGDMRSSFSDVSDWSMRLQIGVTGSSRSIVVDAALGRRVSTGPEGNEHYAPLPTWTHRPE